MKNDLFADSTFVDPDFDDDVEINDEGYEVYEPQVTMDVDCPW